MSRTFVDGRYGNILLTPSGNYECPLLGQAAHLMGSPHAYDQRSIYRTLGLQVPDSMNQPEFLWFEQPYDLGPEECREFGKTLMNVTDDILEKMVEFLKPRYTKDSLKETIVFYGRYYSRLKNGYHCL